MRIEAIQSIGYSEMVIPSIYASALNVRKIEDIRFERTRKVEKLEFITGEGKDMLSYYVGKFLDLRI